MEQAFTFDANDLPLSNVFFGSNRKYSVPRFQRPYAWGIEEITEFWDDLITNERHIFLVLLFSITERKGNGYVDIIDGQQRFLPSHY